MQVRRLPPPVLLRRLTGRAREPGGRSAPFDAGLASARAEASLRDGRFEKLDRVA